MPAYGQVLQANPSACKTGPLHTTKSRTVACPSLYIWIPYGDRNVQMKVLLVLGGEGNYSLTTGGVRGRSRVRRKEILRFLFKSLYMMEF